MVHMTERPLFFSRFYRSEVENLSLFDFRKKVRGTDDDGKVMLQSMLLLIQH